LRFPQPYFPPTKPEANVGAINLFLHKARRSDASGQVTTASFLSKARNAHGMLGIQEACVQVFV